MQGEVMYVMNRIYILILGMMVVTYLPRLLPFLLMNGKRIPARMEEALGYIPYAALGALIVPGFINAIPGHGIASVAGISTAMILSYLKGGVALPVAGAILTCMVLVGYGI